MARNQNAMRIWWIGKRAWAGKTFFAGLWSEWRGRRLEKAYPYLVVDARYEKVRRGGAILSQGVLIVVGIGEDGLREVLGVWVFDSESEASWGAVFAELKERGLRGVRYVVSDDHAGLVRAIGRHFQGVVWQRCQAGDPTDRSSSVGWEVHFCAIV